MTYLMMKSYCDDANNDIIIMEEIQQSNTDANIISNEPLILLFRFPGVLINAYKAKQKNTKPSVFIKITLSALI